MDILNIGYLPFKHDTGKAEIIRTNFIVRGLKEKNNNITTYSYDNNYNKDVLNNLIKILQTKGAKDIQGTINESESEGRFFQFEFYYVGNQVD